MEAIQPGRDLFESLIHLDPLVSLTLAALELNNVDP